VTNVHADADLVLVPSWRVGSAFVAQGKGGVEYAPQGRVRAKRKEVARRLGARGEEQCQCLAMVQPIQVEAFVSVEPVVWLAHPLAQLGHWHLHRTPRLASADLSLRIDLVLQQCVAIHGR